MHKVLLPDYFAGQNASLLRLRQRQHEVIGLHAGAFGE